MSMHLPRTPGTGRQRAFSFVEMMVASAVFALVISAIVWTNLVGMTMMDFTRPKLEAEMQCRRLLDQLVEEISSARIVRVGEGDLATFAPVADGSPMQGSALQLHPTLDTNLFIRYFLDAGDQSLKRITNGAVGATIIAQAVTNDLVFSARTYALATNSAEGDVLTTDRQNMAIEVDLQFSQIGGSGTPVGPDNYFRSYRFRTQVARRTR